MTMLFATGGTVKEVCDLVEQLVGEIIQFDLLIELSLLNGREKIIGNDIFAAITY